MKEAQRQREGQIFSKHLLLYMHPINTGTVQNWKFCEVIFRGLSMFHFKEALG